MHKGNVTIGRIAVVLIVLSLGLPILSEAGVFWEENFENHLAPAWDTGSCSGSPQDGCNPAISTDIFMSAVHSLKSHYDVSCGSGTAQGCGAYYDRSIPPSEDVWVRLKYRTTNFTYNSSSGTKHFYLQGNAYPNFVFENIFGSRQIGLFIQNSFGLCPDGGGPYETCTYHPNMTGVNLNDNQWYCIEGHVKMNTPGVANGAVELWVDGVQTLGYTNLSMRGTQVNGQGGNSSTATVSLVRLYAQMGVGDRYFDDFAVGNTRIGCTGSPSADTTPPAVPAGLLIH